MDTFPIRILIAEDYEPFRQFLVSTLLNHVQFQVSCEVSDGLEAIEKSAELQPDLILLDIGLPLMNGIEAARQIRHQVPHSKLIFVTQSALLI